MTISKKTLLWVDDMRNPNDPKWLFDVIESIVYPDRIPNIVWVKNYDEFVEYIDSEGLPDIICFDHDLGEYGENERNGFTCAKYLVDYCMANNLDAPDVYSQSSNPVGAENILTYISNYRKFYTKNKFN